MSHKPRVMHGRCQPMYSVFAVHVIVQMGQITPSRDRELHLCACGIYVLHFVSSVVILRIHTVITRTISSNRPEANAVCAQNESTDYHSKVSQPIGTPYAAHV